MLAAIFGLLGVIVGGLITAGTNFFLAHRSDRAERRQGTRLVADEIDTLLLSLVEISDYERTPQRGLENDAAAFLPNQEWLAHKTILARSVGDNVWDDLAAFYFSIEAARYNWTLLGHERPLEESEVIAVRSLIEGGHNLIRALHQRPTRDLNELLQSAGTKRDYDHSEADDALEAEGASDRELETIKELPEPE